MSKHRLFTTTLVVVSTLLLVPVSGQLLAVQMDASDNRLGSSRVVSVSTSFNDEFNSPTLNPRWSWYNEDPGLWSLTASPGNLRITSTEGDLRYACGVEAKNVLLQQIPPADFEINARLSFNPTANYQQAGLIILNDFRNYVKLGAVWNGPQCGGQIVEFRLTQNGSPSGSSWYWFNADLSLPAFLRITKSGNSYTAYYSSDGQNFLEVGSMTFHTVASSQMGLYAFNSCFGNPPDIPADIDYLRVISTTPLFDLPLDYQANGLSFNEAFQRCTTALFDHHYPFEKGPAGDQNLLPYTGLPISDTLGTQCRFGVNCYDGHEGYDFDDLSGCGDVALAAADGEIVPSESGCDKEYGCQVVIQHANGYETLYGHLRNDESIKTSGHVTRGEVIGTIGQTGGAQGTHLHFGVYHNGQVIDPSWLGTISDPWEVRSGASSGYLWVGRIQNRTAIDGATGGTITSPSEDTTVYVSAGAHNGFLTFDFSEVPVVGSSAQLRSAGHSFSLHATNDSGDSVTAFQQPIIITTTFSLADMTGIKSGTLALYHWDNSNDAWLPLPTVVDEINSVVTAQTTHLSYFALLGERNAVYIPLVLKQ